VKHYFLGVLQIEDRGEAAKKIRESIFGKYTKQQLEAAALGASSGITLALPKRQAQPQDYLSRDFSPPCRPDF
jgi:hypothetical protein